MKYITLFFFFITALFAHEKLEKVSLQLQWLDQFQFAGYYMAKEKGFYRDAGFDVEFKKHHDGVRVIEDVLSGVTTYGIGRSSLVWYFAQGKQITLLNAILQYSPVTLIALESSLIKSVKDFEYKKIMMTQDAIESATVYAMLRSAQIDIKKIAFQKHTFSLEQLINKEVDLYSGYATNEPFLLEEMQIPYRCFTPKSEGFDFYSDILFTSQEEIERHPQRVARFQEASLKGWEYAFEHIEESVEVVYRKYNPQHKSKKALLFEAMELKKLAYVDDIAFGTIEETKIKRIADLYRVMGLVSTDIDVKKLLFNPQEMRLSAEEKSYLEQKKEIRVCTLTSMAPLSFKRVERAAGIGVELLKEVQEYVQIPLKSVFVSSWEESLRSMREGRCDLLPIATESMCGDALHVTPPYHYEPLVIVTKKKQDYIVDMQSVLKRKFVATKENPFVEELLRRYPKLDISYVKNLEEGFTSVEEGRYFGYIDTLVSAAYAFKNSSNGSLKIAGQFEEQAEMRFGVARGEELLYTIFKRASQELERRGVDPIINRWISLNYIQNVSFAYTKEVAAAMVLILFVFWYRHRLLARKNRELEALREDLQRRVEDAVREIQQKDGYLLHKSRLEQMGELISMVAHQWRQPLSSIAALQISLLMAIELEEYDLKDGVQREKFLLLLEEKLKKIGAQTQQLSSIITDFSDFYRPNKLQEEVLVDTLIQKAYLLLEDTLVREGIVLHLRLHSQTKVKLFQNEFLQALLNIINNAREQLKAKKIEDARIEIQSYDEEGRVVVEISDNALGIEEEIMGRIFEPYFSTKLEKNGTGLGLYMTKNIIEQHHKGHVYARNNGEGATFIIEIGRER